MGILVAYFLGVLTGTTPANGTRSGLSPERDRDYRVQDSLRWAAWCAFFAAVAYAGITFFQWRDSNHNFTISERAWISVDGSITIKDQNVNGVGEHQIVTWIVVPQISNYGRTPATRVSVLFKIDAGMGVRVLWRERSYCKENEDIFNNPKSRSAAPAIFPNSPLKLDYSAFSKQGQALPTAFRYLIGCIVYRDIFRDVHHTKLLYHANNASQPVHPDNAPNVSYLPVESFSLEDTESD